MSSGYFCKIHEMDFQDESAFERHMKRWHPDE